jgi:hypothetical protein
MKKVNHNEIHLFLKEGDILLFRHKGLFGWLVSKYSASDYSHVGIVHVIDGEYYCLEFREFIGCRMYSLKEYIKENCGRIDVFRPAASIQFNGTSISFNEEVAGKITAHAKTYVGQKYSWYTIFFLLQQYVPFFRLLIRQSYIDNIDPKYFVCSTLVAYLYRIYYLDLVSYLSDSFTKPGDIARSPILKYKYTLVCGEENE